MRAAAILNIQVICLLLSSSSPSATGKDKSAKPLMLSCHLPAKKQEEKTVAVASAGILSASHSRMPDLKVNSLCSCSNLLFGEISWLTSKEKQISFSSREEDLTINKEDKEMGNGGLDIFSPENTVSQAAWQNVSQYKTKPFCLEIHNNLKLSTIRGSFFLNSLAVVAVIRSTSLPQLSSCFLKQPILRDMFEE